MKAAGGNDIVEQVITPTKTIPASIVTVRYAPLLFSTHRLWRDMMKIK